MGFKCGIVGLPNVGKSTIFNAMTGAGVAAANFPFCTIEPNTGMVALRDPRIVRLAELSGSVKTSLTMMEFVDIAGLVKGASQGEGLGNQFLANIKQVDAIVEVVRCFDNPDVVHVHGKISPSDDVEVIKCELLLADLEISERRLEKVAKLVRIGQKEHVEEQAVLEQVVSALREEKPIRSLPWTDKERSIVKQGQFLSDKPIIYVANMEESEIGAPEKSEKYMALRDLVEKEGAQVIPICGRIEAEIAELDEADRTGFLEQAGLTESGLDILAREGHRLLDLIVFFTVGPTESRAWTIPRGFMAQQAAGKIHSDMERGFIKAEVYNCESIFQHGSESALRNAGLIRQEGREYIVQDGDVMFIKFNV